MYYPCSENKGADQLRSYCEADLRLCFRLCRFVVLQLLKYIVKAANNKDILQLCLCLWSSAYDMKMVVGGCHVFFTYVLFIASINRKSLQSVCNGA